MRVPARLVAAEARLLVEPAKRVDSTTLPGGRT